MRSISFNLRAEQSLAVSWAREIAFYQKSEDFVTGSALRGAVASAWLADRDADPAFFEEIFEGLVRFETAIPQGFTVVPLSVFLCKYRTQPTCQSWYEDRAVHLTEGLSIHSSCHCGDQVERSKGHIVATSSEANDALLGQRTRTAVNPVTGSSRDRALFAQEALRSGLTFSGRITCIDKLSPSAEKALTDWIKGPQNSSRSIRLGRGKSVMGKAVFENVQLVNDNIKTVSPGRHIVRCKTPLIVLDDAGRPTTDITYEFLRRGLERTAIVHSWVRPTLIGGWHTVSGLPKPADYALVAGTTYVVDVPAEDTNAWNQVQVTGLGHRRREGFGVVEVDPDLWEYPKSSEQSAPDRQVVTTSKGSPFTEIKNAIEGLLVSLRVESGENENSVPQINQIRDLLSVLARDPRGVKEGLEQIKDRPFWQKRGTKVIDARDEIIKQLQGPRREALKARNYFEARYMVDLTSGEEEKA
jgi:CRISPR-associated protein Csx10